MKRILFVLLTAAMAGGAALAQLQVVPGTPEQVRRALAEAPGTWANDAIELVVSRGIYIGYPDGSFGWRDDITRAEMAMVIARLIRTFNLEAFDPNELFVLRQAVAELGDDLAGLRALVEEHGGRLDDAAAALERHEDEIAELWDAILTFDVAPEVFDASDIWLALDALDGRADATEAELAELRGRVAALEAREDPEEADLGPLEARIAFLEARLAEEEAERATLADGLAALTGRVAALEAESASQGRLLAELGMRIDGTSERLSLLEMRVAALEADLADIRATLADHEARIRRLEDALLPDRAPFHISLALYGSAPDGGLIGQVAVGHDSIVGNLGVRASVDFGFGQVPLSIAGAVTYRATMERVDGYAGIGLGLSFEETGNVLFGELLIGASYRFARNIGVFVEGRFRPYFDGSGDGLAALGGGIQLRF